MEVRNSQFTAFIDLFTGNTYIMVVMATTSQQSSDSHNINNSIVSHDSGNGSGGSRFAKTKIPTALIQINIAAARKHFEKFIPENS